MNNNLATALEIIVTDEPVTQQPKLVRVTKQQENPADAIARRTAAAVDAALANGNLPA
jgi:hypothetical protein